MQRVLLVLASILLSLIARLGAQAPVPAIPVTIALPENLLFTGAGRQMVAVSPDGSRFAYVANARLYSMPLAGGQPPTEIAGTASFLGPTTPVFSPDNQSVVFWSSADQTLKRIAVTGGDPVTICKADNPYGMSWGADDHLVVGQGTKGVMRVSAKGGTPETLASVKSDELAHGPQLLPGNALLFTIASVPPVWDKAQIVVQSLSSGARQTIVQGGSDARLVPTGHIVYAVGGSILAVRFDTERLAVTGRAVTVLEDVRAAGATGSTQFAFSESGSLVYVPNAKYRIATVDRQGNQTPIGLLPDSVFALRISPDGQHVAFDSASLVWIAELPSLTPMRRLNGGDGHFPIWSADGRQIVFTSDRDGGVQALFSQRADGTGEPEMLVKPARAPEAWSAPTQRFSFITLTTTRVASGTGTTTDADYDIWTYSLADKKASPLINTAKTQQLGSRFSPDGRWIAYESNETGRPEIFVQPLPGTGATFQVTKQGCSRPLWSLTGRELTCDNRMQMFSIAVQTEPTFNAGEPVPLPITGFVQGTLRRQYDVTPDGKQYLMMFRRPPEIHTVANWFDELKRRVQ